jgi:hypothetical protein
MMGFLIRHISRFALLILLFLTSLAAQWQPGPDSKRIKFSGYEWIVKDSAERRVGPGSNYFSDDAVRVEADGLKLRVFEKDGRFYCAEVVSVASLGYGTYRFHVASNVDGLAPNIVLGLFTWSDDPGEEGSHKELDVELGRWGKTDNDIAQFVVQPYTRPENIIRFPLPADASSSVHSFTWMPHQAHFTSEVRGAVVQDHVFTRRVPAPDKENIRLNLWITGGRMPAAGVLEVMIRSFEFLPQPK